MSKASVVIAMVFASFVVSDSFAQCGSCDPCGSSCNVETKVRSRQVLRLERVCVMNRRGCCVKRLRLVKKCKTRVVTRRTQDVCQCSCVPVCVPVCAPSVATPAEAAPTSAPVENNAPPAPVSVNDAVDQIELIETPVETKTSELN